jgi:Peptidase family M48
MRILNTVMLILALSALPLTAAAQRNSAADQVVDRIISQEQAEMTSLRAYSPMVETYIQNLRGDKDLGSVPAGDKYFMGRAVLAKGVSLEPLTEGDNSGGGARKKIFGGLGNLFSLSMEYLPQGFLQMIYIDNNGFDKSHYKFDYVRREFLGEVRTLVFDVTPLPKAGKGRFVGRIWVEDQDFHVVRFNGAYGGGSRTAYYFHFDSWRVNSGPNLWLPAFIYSEESDLNYAVAKRLSFKAQTRLWGYNQSASAQEQELSKILIESQTPIKDQTTTANDINPIMAQRNWDRQAEDNVVDRLERLRLLAPAGEVDKVLDTVVNNLEVTNNLDIQPEIRCRVLLTSTLESFTIGHTIVFSRGLVDVLPDEPSLAAMVAHEVSHVVLGHRIDGQYAFFDRLLFDEKDTFKHFGFSRTQAEEEAANTKANELLKNSPYKDQLATAKLFLDALQNRQKDIPNLISPHLGDRVPVNLTLASASVPAAQKPADAADSKGAPSSQIVALPLGGRIKMDPWSDKIEMLKSKPAGAVAEREKMPFEVTPFMLYLTREVNNTSSGAPGAVSADSKAMSDPAPQQAPQR